MDTVEILQVNKFARRLRHLKTFSRWSLLVRILKTPLKYLRFLRFHTVNILNKLLPIAPQKRLLFQAGVMGMIMLTATSMVPLQAYSATSVNYAGDYPNADTFPGDILVSDEMGYIVKINPQTDRSSRIGLTDYAVHTVESGETLSLIAEHYAIGTDTVMWENSITNPNSLRIGQKLMIPPVDGLGYKVGQGDTLEKIATKYEISVESIIAHNLLESETVTVGQQLFLPDARPLTPTFIAGNDARGTVATRDYRGTYSAENSYAAPAVGKIFIYPTIGNITNGYHAGHYAVDIGNRSMPPVWAAGGGTVTKASVGTWGGGYGNHVIIDHGNGVKTLYAHLNTVNVSTGQWVNQGDVLGQMGNTGRVYGATGIHLHWEVIVNGVKQFPGNYY